ncbi:MAG: heme ABC transporter ATP-binding protein [Pseudomonadota bacterium]
MIEAQNITVHVGNKSLIDGISFHAEAGKLVAIVGPNGAGKSTLLKVLAGELHPTNGGVYVDGLDIRKMSAAQLAARRAVVPQASHLAFPFRVSEVVALGASIPGFVTDRSSPHQPVVNALKRVDLEAFADRSYASLSGGERQRVHLARAFCQLAVSPEHALPSVLFLDEPTASLDLAHQLLILDEARSMSRDGHLVVVVLHDLNLAATYADTIMVMSKGQLAARGAPTEIMTNDLLSEVFGCRIEVGVISPANTQYVIPQLCHLRPNLAAQGQSDRQETTK